MKNNGALVRKPSSVVEKTAPGAKRILSGMVWETLALTKTPKLNEPLGLCPNCGGKVFEEQERYACEKSQTKINPCKFYLGKNILQQPIDIVQMRQLLQVGKTDLLDQFISQSGKQYSAHLVLHEGGVRFEFPTRIRIVIVNDDLGILELMESYISDWFKEAAVLTFQNGDKAWQEIQRETPDILITDMARENDPVDGWAMVSLLVEKKVKYPVIVASALTEFSSENDHADWKVRSAKFHDLLEHARKAINITTIAIPFDFEELQKFLRSNLIK
jgi:CheY-like chemotaxis protein